MSISGTRSMFGRATLRALRGTAITVVAAVAIAAAVASYETRSAVSGRPADREDARPAVAPAVASQGGGVVTLDPESQEKGGIETASPLAAEYQDHVRAYGTVLALDRLTSLYNQAIAANAQLGGAQVKLTASKIANDRAKNLLKVFSTAQVQAEAAEATFKIDEASVASAQAQLDILKNSAIQDWGRALGLAIVTRAPLAEGLVLRKTVLVQLSLRPGTFAVPPRHIKLTYGGTPGIEAEFVSDATQIDPKIQSVGFWYVAPASVGLVAGTSILAYLPKGETQPGVGIPPSAVVWQAGKPWIFVSGGGDRFERRVIDSEATPAPDGGYVVPVAKLPRDTKVVVAGAQTLLSEETRSQMPAQEDEN